MSKTQGERGRSVGADPASSAPTRCGSTCWPRARCGCPSGSTGGRSPQVPGDFLHTLRNTYEFFRLYAGAGRRAPPPARRAPGRRPLGPGRLDGTVAEVTARLGGLRADRRGPGDHGLRGGRPLELVRAAEPGPLLGAGRRGRSGRGRHAARMPGHGEPAAGPAAPFVSDWLHRALTGPIGASCRASRRPGAGAGRGAGGRPWTRSAGSPPGPRRPGDRQAPGAAAARPRCRWRCPPRCRGPGVRATAGHPAGRGERQARSRSVESDADLVRLEAQAQLPVAGQAVRQGDARGGRGGRAARPRTSCGPWKRAGRSAWHENGMRTRLSCRGCGGRAGGDQRLAGAERRAVRRRARSRCSTPSCARRAWPGSW